MADLTLSIQAQDKASPVLRGVGKSAEEMGRKLDGAGESGKKGGESIFGGVLKADLAMKALSKAADILVDTLKQGFDGLVQQEQADLRLSAALKRLGYDSNALLPALKAQADAFENTTLLQGEQVQALQELLLSYGVAPADIEKTSKAIIDYAAVSGKDATTAARTLMQAVNGSGEEMQAFGVKVTRTSSAARDLRSMVDELSRRFNGSAKASAAGMAGSLDQLSKAQDKLSKALADFFVKTGIAGTVIKGATDALTGLTTLLTAPGTVKNAFVLEEANKQIAEMSFELDGLNKKIAQYREEGFFANDADRERSLAPLEAEKKALRDRLSNLVTGRDALLKAQQIADGQDIVSMKKADLERRQAIIDARAKEVQELIESARAKLQAIKDGNKKIRKASQDEIDFEKRVKEERQAKARQEMLAALGIDDASIAAAEESERQLAEGMKVFLDGVGQEFDRAVARQRVSQRQLDDAMKLLFAENKRFIDAYVAESKSHEDEMRQAGMALGQAFLSGLDEQLTQVESGGDMDMAALLAAIVPAAVTMAVIAASGGAAAPYAPLIGAAAGMVVKHGLAASKGGGRTRYHSGGMVDDRPRFHGGGGLASDEVEAVLQTGEQVFSRGDVARAGGPRAVEAMRKGAGQVNVYVSTTDAQSFSKYMGDRGGSGLARTVDENAGEFAQRMRRLARRGS